MTCREQTYRGYTVTSDSFQDRWELRVCYNYNDYDVVTYYKNKIRLKDAFNECFPLIDKYIAENYKNIYHMNDKTGQVFITNTIEEYEEQTGEYTWEIKEKSNYVRIKKKLSEGASVSEALKYPISKKLKKELLNVINEFQLSIKNKHIKKSDEQSHYFHDQNIYMMESKKGIGEWGCVGGNFKWYYNYECSDYIIYLSPVEYTDCLIFCDDGSNGSGCINQILDVIFYKFYLAHKKELQGSNVDVVDLLKSYLNSLLTVNDGFMNTKKDSKSMDKKEKRELIVRALDSIKKASKALDESREALKMLVLENDMTITNLADNE